MKTKWTPGPWKMATTYKAAQKGHASIVAWTDQSLPIAYVKPLHLEPMESYANAELIALAPQLYEALKQLAEQTAGSTDAVFNPRPEFLNAHQTARSLLARLEGGEANARSKD